MFNSFNKTASDWFDGIPEIYREEFTNKYFNGEKPDLLLQEDILLIFKKVVLMADSSFVPLPFENNSMPLNESKEIKFK